MKAAYKRSTEDGSLRTQQQRARGPFAISRPRKTMEHGNIAGRIHLEHHSGQEGSRALPVHSEIDRNTPATMFLSKNRKRSQSDHGS